MPAEQAVALPRAFAARVLVFLRAKLSGNIKISVRDGEVEGVRIEEVVKKTLDKDG